MFVKYILKGCHIIGSLFFIIYYVCFSSGTEYGTDWVVWAGATGADPEIMILKDISYWTVADGRYMVDLDPYHVENDVTDFKISVGHPDQSVEFFNFTFDMAKTDGYPATWGYSAVKVVKVGNSYTCTLAPEFE